MVQMINNGEKNYTKICKKSFLSKSRKKFSKENKIFWIFSKKDSKKSWYIFEDFRVVYILPKHVSAFILWIVNFRELSSYFIYLMSYKSPYFVSLIKRA